MTVVLIPARLASTRFPAKVLAADTGRPLIAHVAERAAAAAGVERVVVATDADAIAAAARAHGHEAVLTRDDHPNGTCRLAEAARVIGLAPDAVVVNVQGDEPELEPDLVAAAASSLDAVPGAAAGTVASPFAPGEDPSDPNIVKAVVATPASPAGPAVGEVGRALCFTRARAPFAREPESAAAEGPPPVAPLKHVGLYAYRVADLLELVALPPTPLERTERLEQLRWLEHGRTVAVAIRRAEHHGIDTPEQYAAFVRRVRGC